MRFLSIFLFYRQTSEMWYFLEKETNVIWSLTWSFPFFQRFLSGFLAIAINLCDDMVKKCMRMKRSLHESWLNLDSWKAFLRQFWEWVFWLLFYTLGQNPTFWPLIEFKSNWSFEYVRPKSSNCALRKFLSKFNFWTKIEILPQCVFVNARHFTHGGQKCER